MFGLVVFIFIGLIVATIAKALMPGRDPGLGITILLGTTAQIAAGFGGRLLGWDRYGQPWSFVLSITAAMALLYTYRDTAPGEVLARLQSSPAASGSRSVGLARQEPLRSRMVHALGWIATGAFMLGTIGFLIGFFGPMQFHPGANQGPMLGIFITGPGGTLLGAVLGGWLRIARPEWPARWRFWTLNAASVAYGLLVLYAVAQPVL